MQFVHAIFGRTRSCSRPCFRPYLLTCTCVGIHLGRVEPASPIALTTSRTEALQARRSCASSLDTFIQSFLHRAWPKTRGPEIGSRSALVVVAHIFSWPPVRLRHVRGGVGRRRSLILPTQHSKGDQSRPRFSWLPGFTASPLFLRSGSLWFSPFPIPIIVSSRQSPG